MRKKEKGILKKERKETIKKKIQLMLIALIAIALVVVSSISIVLNYRATLTSLSQTLASTAAASAGQIQYRLKAEENTVQTIGLVKRLSDSTVSADEKVSVLSKYGEFYKFVTIGMFDTTGIKLGDSSVNISDRVYFKTALSGTATVSDPVYSKDTDKFICAVAAPIYEGGDSDGKIVGVVVACIDASVLSDFVSSIAVSQNGSAFIINNEATLIAHKNFDLVVSGDNSLEQAKTDSSMKSLASIEEQMIKGDSGFGFYTYQGVKKCIAYAPIEGTSGWSIAVNAPVTDFLGGTIQSIAVTVILLIISLAISVLVSSKMANSIGIPIQKCAKRLDQLAHGDLKTEVPVINTRDETKQLAQSTELLVNNLNVVIGDMDYILGEMSNGNFAIHTKAGDEAYVGDFDAIKLSMRQLNHRLTATLTQISEASEQVASGSEQLASGSVGLSQGATEQAASVEELAATINEISVQTGENAEHAVTAQTDVKQLGEHIKRSDDQMKQLIVAMDDINDASIEIKKIIKTIEDIAFQTNILALNAAIEAARAGVAGKGFAVVADEVRNLAGKSGVAASSTTELIEKAIRSVDDGSRLVSETGASLNEVVQRAEHVVVSVDKILLATERQAESVNQVNMGIEQISGVVQTNSSAAEESAATSEELSSQADILKNLVATFQFNRK
jgi:methyl-accepting chemotaxis protein